MFKKFIVGFFVFLCSASNAKDVWIQLHDDILLEDIGRGYSPVKDIAPENKMFLGWLLIKQPIQSLVDRTNGKVIRILSEDLMPNNKKLMELSDKDGFGKIKCVLELKDESIYKSGSFFTIDSPRPVEITLMYTHRDSADRTFFLAFDFQQEKSSCQFSSVSLDDAYLPLTVGEFRATYGNYFDILAREPYPDMGEDIVIDIEMSKIMSVIQKQNASRQDYEKIIHSFYYLDTKVHNLPEAFYYYFIEVLSKIKIEQAKLRAKNYIKKYGKNGKYYTKIINILSDANKN